ncbi:hypothetical protein C2845_PM02G02670 [Panicum miliaceum]|uniref:Myb/SANT-like domain-containing protein n=1 Tax=Panicum miliaceum TaxID=4540 RepID=A0A3L6S8Y0_PANMI|nr:hypothetical protein C2845_PM02G02670 [Panicum miliaceum]
MDRKRANWDPATTRLFFDLCIAEKEKFNFSNQGLTKDRWRNMYRSFIETAGTIFTAKQMSNKLQTFKKRYNAWKELQNSSGLRRNKTMGAIEADAEWWETHNSSQDSSESEAVEPRGAPPPYDDQLDILFGSRQDRGPFMWAGGISESNTPATQEPVGPSSKRATMNNEVNSSPKKKTCSMEDYMRQICESIVHRSCREQGQTREQAEGAGLLGEDSSILGLTHVE